MPGPGRELIGEAEIAEVLDVLRSGYVSRYGPDDARFPAKVRTFEEEVMRRSGARYAVAVNAGTSALLMAMAAVGVGPGDEVIVPGFTYVASISAIVYSRARPVLAEIDGTFDLDPDDVEARIGPRTKAILAVHMLGNPARIPELKAVADRHGLPLIEDCAQAFGGTYEGKWVGTFGAAGIYSFNEYKTITCGDGGMLVTDDEGIYQRAFAMHDQGHLPFRKGVEVGRRPLLGLNFRMTELEGAVLVAQMRRLDEIKARLHANRDAVHAVLSQVPGLAFRDLPDPDGDISTHFVVVFPDAASARAVAAEVGSITLDTSGWHVYSLMEHVLSKRTITERGCPFDCACTDDRPAEYHAGMLPRTDALLARSLSFSIGVSDPNLAPYGVTIRADEAEARARAEAFAEACRRHLG